MSDKKQISDKNLLSALRQRGFIVPKTEQDIDAFEQAIKEHNIPPLPTDLNDPAAILKRGYSHRSPQLATEPDEDVTDLARAARDGKAIPQSVLDKMKKDRDDVEQGK
jgi:hypothetical protein